MRPARGRGGALAPTEDRDVQITLGFIRIAFSALILTAVPLTSSPDPVFFGVIIALLALDVVGSTVATMLDRHRWSPSLDIAADTVLLLATIAISGGAGSVATYVLALIPLLAIDRHRPPVAVWWGVGVAAGFMAVVIPGLDDGDLRPILQVITLIVGTTGIAYINAGIARGRTQRVEQGMVAQRLLVEDALEVEARERRRLAELMHDEILQLLLASRQDITEAREGDIEALGWADRQIGRAVQTIREMIRGRYVPPQLQDSDFEYELRLAVDEMARRTPIQVGVSAIRGGCGRHDGLVVAITRELVNNAIKHSQAEKVTVIVRSAADGSRIELEVCDDGVGMEAAQLERAVEAGHIGLASVRARAESVGGTFEVLSLAIRGFCVRVTLPL